MLQDQLDLAAHVQALPVLLLAEREAASSPVVPQLSVVSLQPSQANTAAEQLGKRRVVAGRCSRVEAAACITLLQRPCHLAAWPVHCVHFK